MTPFPDRGQIIWLNFNPQQGHEQAGRRPALVISPFVYNQKTRLALVCPITNHIKGYPFEVEVPPDLPITGVILSDHLKNLDWHARNAEYICTIPQGVLNLVIAKIEALITSD